MGLFDKIRSAFGNTEPAPNTLLAENRSFEAVIKTAVEEYRKAGSYFFNEDLNKIPTWTENVKGWADKDKIAFALWLVPGIHDYTTKDGQVWNTSSNEYQTTSLKEAFLKAIFKSKLVMDEDDVKIIYGCFSDHSHKYRGIIGAWPVAMMINQIANQYGKKIMPEKIKEVFIAIKNDLAADQKEYLSKERAKLAAKVDALLFAGSNQSGAIKPSYFVGEDRFAAFANPIIQAMQEQEQNAWFQLLAMAQKVSGAKPTQKYLDNAKAIFKESGSEKYKATLQKFLQFLGELKDIVTEKPYTYADGTTYNYTTAEYITSVNADAVKGLVWTCAHFHDALTLKTVAALAERAFKKIPGQGPTAASLGNACLYALYKSRGLDGIGHLSRLRLRIKQNSTQALIEKYLNSAADEQGVSVSEVEDMAVDDYGLREGKRTYLFDDYNAELSITGIGKTDINWVKPDGTPQKSVPAFIKEKHAAKFKKIKDTAKQVEQTLTAQRDRIDRMFRTGRTISKENFDLYYLQHGLMGYITPGIIWNFVKQGTTREATRVNGHWVNSKNELVDITGAETVSLWHPVQASVQQIREWREFLILHKIQQPLKQAFRELYLLTEAEINTITYSNRMAAHLLRQHQFNSLAKTRGWKYALMGAFDNGVENGTASLDIKEFNIRAEYWIFEVNADDAMNDTGIWNYVSTDQVRFINTITNETLKLADVPPVVFSESMRDVDLFVGVASVGNDPAWQDNGGLPAYRDYWTSYSFGELSEVAKNRKEILSTLVPRLKIRDVATIQDKFLVVKGKLRTYKIHIGSTNILMEPNDQYLCIVPDRSKNNHTENLFIPFEGDNGLSIVLSKAFLLADDDKITDSTIVSQIKYKV